MALATLSIDLVAKLAQFEGDMGKAARASEAASQRITNALGTVKATLGGLAAGITFGSIIALGRATIDSVDKLNDLKDATGSSIENLSALEDVAARTGTSMDTVSTAVIKFNKVLADAKPGSDAARALEALGLSAAQLKAIDPAEALLKTAVAMQGFADDGNKARLTQELFGKSLREVAPFLKDLADKGELVATVTTKQAEEAEKFNKELFALQKSSQDAARAIAGPLVEGMNTLIAKFREGSAAGKGFLETAASIYANNVRNFYGIASKPTSTGGATGDFGTGAGGGRGSVNPAFVKASVGDIFGGTNATGGAKTQKDQISDASRALASYVEGLSRTLEKTDELSASEKALNFLRSQGAQGQIPQVRELVLGLAAQVDKEKELADQLKLKRQLAIDAGDAVAKSNEEYQALLSRLLAATPTAKLSEQRKDVQILTDEFEAGRLAEELYLEAVSARLDLTNEKVTQTKSLAEDLGLTFASAFEDAIVGGKNFSDVLKGLEQDILRIVIRKLVTEPLGNALTGALGGGSGGGGGIFGKLFSFDGGGYTGMGGRSGGLDGKGGFMAMLHPQETVVDHTRSGGRGGSGGTVNVVINQTVGDVATVSMLQKNNQYLVRQIEAGIGRSQTYGGALS